MAFDLERFYTPPMPAYVELDPEVARQAIEGFEDELAPEAQKLDTLYRSFTCPRHCGPLQRENDPRHAFATDSLVPRSLLRCSNCGFLIEPHTRVVLENGNASRIPVESSPLILPGRERVR